MHTHTHKPTYTHIFIYIYIYRRKWRCSDEVQAITLQSSVLSRGHKSSENNSFFGFITRLFAMCQPPRRGNIFLSIKSRLKTDKIVSSAIKGENYFANIINRRHVTFTAERNRGCQIDTGNMASNLSDSEKSFFFFLSA